MVVAPALAPVQNQKPFSFRQPKFLFSNKPEYYAGGSICCCCVLKKSEEFPSSNAVYRKLELPHWRGGFSLGIDLGLSRTGLALSKGFSIRPLTVLEFKGQKLERKILDIAQLEEVDEFIIGIPKSWDGKETAQSNKVRSVAGRLAIVAAERGWRVYLQDEHGTSADAITAMIDMGLSKSARQGKSDAYAAMMILDRYFSMSGQEAEFVLPKEPRLQEKLRRGPPKDDDFFPMDNFMLQPEDEDS